MNLYKYASPAAFYPLAGKLIPWFAVPAAFYLRSVCTSVSSSLPPISSKAKPYRIMFIHVPAAWMGMFLYVLMAFYAGIGWAFNARLSSMMASSLAVTGAMFTFISLVTGALWGKPTWGTYWVWDARMTSTLILLFLYIGFISLQSAIDDPRRADRAGAVLALVGVINVPIIYFSVQWWNTLASGRDDSHVGQTDYRDADAGGLADHAWPPVGSIRWRLFYAAAQHHSGERTTPPGLRKELG